MIRSLRVQGGVLDGTAINFAPQGLNVIIGARGSGKTSVIELIRFVLDCSPMTEEGHSSGLAHAEQILGDGEVTLHLVVGGEEVVLSRTATTRTGEVPEQARRGTTILSQKELESLGRTSNGLIRLIDSHSDTEHVDLTGSESQLLRHARALTAEAEALRQKIAGSADSLAAMSTISQALEEARRERDTIAAQASETTDKVQALKALEARVNQLEATLTYSDDARRRIEEYCQALRDLLVDVPAVEWPDDAVPFPELADVGSLLTQSDSALRDAQTAATSALAHVGAFQKDVQSSFANAGEQARVVRSTLEGLDKRLGDASRRVDALNRQLAKLLAEEKLVGANRAKLTEVESARSDVLDDLDSVRSERFSLREGVAERLTDASKPLIKVEVRHQSIRKPYEQKLTELLRNSNLQYKALVAKTTSTLAPRAVVDAALRDDAALLAERLQIDSSRAAKMIAALTNGDYAALLATPPRDQAILSLLVGGTYRGAENLSVGQRCTAVLPLLLSQPSDLLAIDQPEDHLDNAYVVRVLVDGIKEKAGAGQVIVATHNPNIPVLGEATHVIVLESDGRRCYVDTQGKLDDPEVKTAITTLMEGGAAAFERRAKFYGKDRPT